MTAVPWWAGDVPTAPVPRPAPTMMVPVVPDDPTQPRGLPPIQHASWSGSGPAPYSQLPGPAKPEAVLESRPGISWGDAFRLAFAFVVCLIAAALVMVVCLVGYGMAVVGSTAPTSPPGTTVEAVQGG